jgi:ribosome recycling factor
MDSNSQSSYTHICMAYNFSVLKQNIKNLEEYLKKEFTTIRTGRATPAILDGVKVDAYGSLMPINQLASVAIEDARSLRITPYDPSQAKGIEKAILVADLGLSVAVDERGLRVTFPELTSDRRGTLVKIAKQKLEEAKVTLRNEREKVVKEVDAQEKVGSISEDEKFRTKAELQKAVDEAGKILDELFNKKEKEISE